VNFIYFQTVNFQESLQKLLIGCYLDNDLKENILGYSVIIYQWIRSKVVTGKSKWDYIWSI